ncbi:CLAVATA3/ESR (CLE)-related protein TDIF [Tripterygium wilfordii]|uniref:CLAVATA3/ESR (CLE)-related protein TDIF n=1 Tax=Tripterygium wilfordii TaxID=458696 RepID=UPI0018F862C8|nr:CLAVATA3/ESR (CLE)-related protein TDIF [Tripterygium wilfordii]
MAYVVSSITSFTFFFFFFFFLVMFQYSTMANKESRFLHVVTSTNDNEAAAATGRKGISNVVHIPPPSQSRRRERLRARSRSTLPWQEKIFNASEHEVPSGPNPISNR